MLKKILGAKIMNVKNTIKQVTPKPPLKLIIAGNNHQYADYIRSRHIKRSDARYVYDDYVLRGHPENTEVIFIGTYYNRKDINYMLEICRIRRYKIFYDEL